ncbi:von Willebrand factor type A domain-containing protein [Myxococcus sp. AM011]|uniref:YfbK domain-containing protein n=1 Tax=Myxococcus sp. AM011 TaxID=2745200 RepID=UPI001595BBE2|nr:von Willebrand factor type A domain-containing protein [Myxococcus sp. AM011]NVJ21539.1 von Willebrand factor type A domain-containing protein [Myxococcus sp. AM011]
MKTALLRSLLGVLLCLAMSAWAQGGSGTVSGSVLQARGQQPLAGVKVSAASSALASPRTTLTDARGHYQLPSLPAGLYTLRFEKESFQASTRVDVKVEAGQTLTVSVELSPLASPLPPAVASGTASHSFSPLAPFAPPLRLESDGVAWMVVPRAGDIRDRAPPWALPQASTLAPEGAGQSLFFTPGSRPLRDSDTRGHGVNPTIDTEEERVSTYTLQVSTASYALTRGYLERDSLPAEEAVRVEDFVNTFELGEDGDAVGPFVIHVEGFPSPSRKGYHVVRVSVRAREDFTDVGVQLEFDRKAVARYRLVGYENQSATPEPFDDDAEPVAVPLAAGTSVTAVYEVKLMGPAIAFGTLRVLYEEGENTMWRRVQKLLPSSVLRSSATRVAPSTRLTYVAAAFAEKLRGSYWTRTLDWARLHALWQEIGEPLASRPDVVELGALIKKAGTLDQRKDRFGPPGSLSNMDPDNLPAPGR